MWLPISFLGYQKVDNSNNAPLRTASQDYGLPEELLPKGGNNVDKSIFEGLWMEVSAGLSSPSPFL